MRSGRSKELDQDQKSWRLRPVHSRMTSNCGLTGKMPARLFRAMGLNRSRGRPSLSAMSRLMQRSNRVKGRTIYSITSSASASSVGGMVKPSVFAVR
jgi:hypothetical protein